MKILNSAFAEHLSLEATTVCRCWVMELKDGSRIGFTDHDCDLIVDGTTCEREAGVEASGVEEQLGLSVDSSEIAGALQSGRITEQDIRAGKYDNAKVTTYIVNWADPAQFALDRVMLVGEILQEDGVYRVELRGISSLLDQTKGRQFIRRCQAELGDGRCRFDLENSEFSSQGAVLDVLSPTVISVSGLQGFENGWFTFGSLHWQTGSNAGRKVEVSSHTRNTDTVTLGLWQPLLSCLEVGDQFGIVAGCNKQFETCKTKFSNAINFQGFPHMPGNDFALSHAGNSEKFDGGPIVP